MSNGIGNHVGNGLRFAGTRWTLYHQVAAFVYGQHGQQLRTIGIYYLEQLSAIRFII